MKRLRILLIASALMAGGTALASAQPRDHDGYHDRDDRRGDRDDRRFVRRDFDRDDHRYFVGQRRFFNGYYWTWDGGRWYRSNRGVVVYFGF